MLWQRFFLLIKMRWNKTNKFIKWLFPNYTWNSSNHQNKIYLTFDDGPTPDITNWVLNELKKYNAKATFFCIGDNVKKYPEIYDEVIVQGHSIGNHTFNHLDGFTTNTNLYLQNIELCETEFQKQSNFISDNKLFRPPFGKITPFQSNKLRKLGYTIIMWDVISYDFDTGFSRENCLQKVVENTTSGSIVVFHDSVKAFTNLQCVLPKALKLLSEKGFVFEKL